MEASPSGLYKSKASPWEQCLLPLGMPRASLTHSRHDPAVTHHPSAPFTQMLAPSRLFLDHTQCNGFPGLQLPQVDATGIGPLVRQLHCLKHDRAIVVGDIAHQVYTVLEAALALGVPMRHVEVIAQNNFLLKGRSKA